MEKHYNIDPNTEYQISLNNGMEINGIFDIKEKLDYYKLRPDQILNLKVYIGAKEAKISITPADIFGLPIPSMTSVNTEDTFLEVDPYNQITPYDRLQYILDGQDNKTHVSSFIITFYNEFNRTEVNSLPVTVFGYIGEKIEPSYLPVHLTAREPAIKDYEYRVIHMGLFNIGQAAAETKVIETTGRIIAAVPLEHTTAKYPVAISGYVQSTYKYGLTFLLSKFKTAAGSVPTISAAYVSRTIKNKLSRSAQERGLHDRALKRAALKQTESSLVMEPTIMYNSAILTDIYFLPKAKLTQRRVTKTKLQKPELLTFLTEKEITHLAEVYSSYQFVLDCRGSGLNANNYYDALLLQLGEVQYDTENDRVYIEGINGVEYNIITKNTHNEPFATLYAKHTKLVNDNIRFIYIGYETTLLVPHIFIKSFSDKVPYLQEIGGV